MNIVQNPYYCEEKQKSAIFARFLATGTNISITTHPHCTTVLRHKMYMERIMGRLKTLFTRRSPRGTANVAPDCESWGMYITFTSARISNKTEPTLALKHRGDVARFTYIGRTSNPKNRPTEHQKVYLKKNPHIHIHNCDMIFNVWCFIS